MRSSKAHSVCSKPSPTLRPSAPHKPCLPPSPLHPPPGPPEGQGSRPLQQRLQASGTELKQLVSSLLAVYLRLKQGELAAALQLYLARWAAYVGVCRGQG